MKLGHIVIRLARRSVEAQPAEATTVTSPAAATPPPPLGPAFRLLRPSPRPRRQGRLSVLR